MSHRRAGFFLVATVSVWVGAAPAGAASKAAACRARCGDAIRTCTELGYRLRTCTRETVTLCKRGRPICDQPQMVCAPVGTTSTTSVPSTTSSTGTATSSSLTSTSSTTSTTRDGGCPANPAGGPNEFLYVVQAEGTDLDNGWTGQSHNQPTDYGTSLRLCLKDCDASGSTPCTQADGTNDVNPAVYGAPQPLLAANVPMCVVNRFNTDKVSNGMVNFTTGDMSMTVNLLSDVYFTSQVQLCPRCTGSDLGMSGTCQGGPNNGKRCVTDGVVTVPNAPPPNRYALSSSCPPGPPNSGTLTIPLAETTGTTRLNGPKPCGASQDNSCGGEGPCDGACVCASHNAAGDCVAASGGIAQVCCHSNPNKSCNPTGAGELGYIERAGKTQPPAASAGFPKCGTGAVLAATFCEPATTSSLINTVTGLPGPGASLLPVKWQVKNTGDADCP